MSLGILFGDMIADDSRTRLSWTEKLRVFKLIIQTANSVSLDKLSADHFIWMWHLSVVSPRWRVHFLAQTLTLLLGG